MNLSPADTAFANCIKAQYKNTCQKCGIVGRMECSHIHSRRHRTIRWCKENALPKCHGCHRWWHENPTESGAWFEDKYGSGFVDMLVEKKNLKCKVTKKEEKEIAKHYRGELKKIEADPDYQFKSWQ